jgi:hypothetical protein
MTATTLSISPVRVNTDDHTQGCESGRSGRPRRVAVDKLLEPALASSRSGSRVNPSRVESPGDGLPQEAKARHMFVAGDIAEIVVDWSIDGTGPDSEHVHLEGSASDIARRGADGRLPPRGETARIKRAAN